MKKKTRKKIITKLKTAELFCSECKIRDIYFIKHNAAILGCEEKKSVFSEKPTNERPLKSITVDSQFLCAVFVLAALRLISMRRILSTSELNFGVRFVDFISFKYLHIILFVRLKKWSICLFLFLRLFHFLFVVDVHSTLQWLSWYPRNVIDYEIWKLFCLFSLALCLSRRKTPTWLTPWNLISMSKWN